MAPQTYESSGLSLFENLHFNLAQDPVILLLSITQAVQTKFQRFVVGITQSNDTIFKKHTTIDENIISKIEKELKSKGSGLNHSIASFAKVKYYLDKFFYDLTQNGTILYSYKNSYLVPSSVLTKQANISRPTLSRRVQQGLECIKEAGHNSYPRHNQFYLKSSLWTSRIKSLQESYRIRNVNKKQLISNIKEEIKKYEKQYNASFEKAFKDVLDGTIDIYELDEPDDFKDWKDLIEELQELE
ncbi:hypothetical protein [Fictibacillus sp. BK138]|uniref:hypothetical protein n=1 Tax=Fictibacillus sp. BK138 TaxID=2512121 RepID=UPI00102A1121|nr:hypothetical protein [Fictibacillus sp. BK138]RZT21444.1 hypothetical protein EV282_0506 [Fictibacillus sp. BK138]